MSITRDIVSAYRSPGQVMARRLPGDEGSALTYLIVACLLLFIGRLPVLARNAHLNPEDGNLMSLIYGAFLGAALLAPLVFYGLAAISFVIFWLLGWKAGGVNIRLALFWTLLVISPLMLFQGMVEGMVGVGPSLTLVNIFIGLAFIYLWAGALRAASATKDG